MKKPRPATAPTQQRWEALAKSLAPRGVELSAMFGMPALKFNGNWNELAGAALISLAASLGPLKKKPASRR